MKSLAAALLFIPISLCLAPPSEAETLKTVNSWRDVSMFLQRHEISKETAELYALRSCSNLPDISTIACMSQSLSDPQSYIGLNTEWAAAQDAQQRARQAARHVEERLHAVEAMKRELPLLEQRIRQAEAARAEVVATLDEMTEANASSATRNQGAEVLKNTDASLKALRNRLSEIKKAIAAVSSQ